MKEIIRIVDFTYKYPKSTKLALRNINLSISEGEVVAIMGPNGAGKTTLCYAVTGLLFHFFGGEYQGNIYVMGKSVPETQIYDLIQDVGIVFQEYENQIIGSIVKDDVSFGPSNLGLEPEEIKRRVNKALEKVGLKGYENRETYTLSGGEKQRLALAGILALKPKIIVLDEPLSQLDPKGRLELTRVLKELKEEGHTIILVEHRCEEVAEIADRVIVLRNGAIILDGDVREVFSRVDELKKIGIKPPQVTELLYYLSVNMNLTLDKLPLSISEAKEYIKYIKEFFSKKQVDIKFSLEKRSIQTDKFIIEVNDLWYTYSNGVKALKGVSLKIYEGEFVAIIGQNGSGKTTLVKHFVGLLKPTQGVVRVYGLETWKTSIAKLAKYVGLVFQNPDYQLFANSVKDEVAFGLRNLGLSASEIKERVKEALRQVGLEGYEDKSPLLLSKSEKQKVALASILARDPQIIIVDEPTTGQDYHGVRNIMKILSKLNRQGKTIIMVTHDMNIVAEYAQRVILLHQGRIVLDGPSREVFSRIDILEEIGLRPPQIVYLSHLLKDSLKGEIILSIEDLIGEDYERVSTKG